jgi:hypothetical protein
MATPPAPVQPRPARPGHGPPYLALRASRRRAGDDLNNGARRFVGLFTKVALTAA